MSSARQVELTRDEAKNLIALARNEADNIHEAIGEMAAEGAPTHYALNKADALEAAALKLYDAFGFTDNDFEVGPDGSLI